MPNKSVKIEEDESITMETLTSNIKFEGIKMESKEIPVEEIDQVLTLESLSTKLSAFGTKLEVKKIKLEDDEEVAEEGSIRLHTQIIRRKVRK